MLKEGECYAYFMVAGSFDPDAVSQRVGMAPTERWRKGDLNPRTNRERGFSRWILGSRLGKTSPFEKHVQDVLDHMDMNRTAFRKTSIELGGTMQLVGRFHAGLPVLTFERSIVERMAEYALSLDCDFSDVRSEIWEES